MGYAAIQGESQHRRPVLLFINQKKRAKSRAPAMGQDLSNY
jgi:hypothetical protein